MVVPEAPLEMTKFGLRPGGPGWFVVNARELRWRDTGGFGAFCDFEGKRRFPDLGINLNVLQPGQPMGMYHRENRQEGFLVLAGKCLLIVESEERATRPPQLRHRFVRRESLSQFRPAGRRSPDRNRRARSRRRLAGGDLLDALRRA